MCVLRCAEVFVRAPKTTMVRTIPLVKEAKFRHRPPYAQFRSVVFAFPPTLGGGTSAKNVQIYPSTGRFTSLFVQQFILSSHKNTTKYGHPTRSKTKHVQHSPFYRVPVHGLGLSVAQAASLYFLCSNCRQGSLSNKFQTQK